jgi:hypothetical protein
MHYRLEAGDHHGKPARGRISTAQQGSVKHLTPVEENE